MGLIINMIHVEDLKFFSGSIEMRNCLDFIRIKLSSGVFKENHL